MSNVLSVPKKRILVLIETLLVMIGIITVAWIVLGYIPTTRPNYSGTPTFFAAPSFGGVLVVIFLVLLYMRYGLGRV